MAVRPFILRRLISFRLGKEGQVDFRGVDRRGVPFTFFKSVTAKVGAGKLEQLKGEPYTVTFKEKEPVKIKVEFYKYLGEPDL